jgi:predicted nucleic-acid-binding protein
MPRPIKAFVDTNVFIRFFVKDDSEKAAGLERLFQKVQQGEIALYIMPIVILEIVWVLEKFYKWSRKDVSEIIETILSTPEIRVEMKDVIFQAIQLYKDSNVKFADAFITQWVIKEGGSLFYTYDKKHFKTTKLEIKEP